MTKRNFTSRRSLLAWCLIAVGLVVATRLGVYGLGLLVVGVVLLPLRRSGESTGGRIPLDRKAVRGLSDYALDVLETLLAMGGPYGLTDLKLYSYLQANGHAAVRDVDEALDALGACGLIELRELANLPTRDPERPYARTCRPLSFVEADDALSDERLRRIKGRRPGRRSRPSSLAERIAL